MIFKLKSCIFLVLYRELKTKRSRQIESDDDEDSVEDDEECAVKESPEIAFRKMYSSILFSPNLLINYDTES